MRIIISTNHYRRQIRKYLFLILCVLTGGIYAEAETFQITLIKSGKSQVYDTVISAFKRQIDAQCTAPCKQGISIKVISKDNFDKDIKTDLFVPIGRSASKLVSESGGKPILYGMLPESSWHDVSHNKQNAVLFIDQPQSNNLRLIQTFLPKVRRVGIFTGPTSRATLDHLEQVFSGSGLKLISEHVSQKDEIGPALNRLIKNSDIILALPDPLIFNRKSIFNILLKSYQNEVPIIGYSKSFAKAGALYSLHSLPNEIGRQLADITISFKGHRKFSKQKYYPDTSGYSVNARVARSLNIDLPSEDAIPGILGQAKP